MDTKLTLSVDPKVVQKAKKYAEKTDQSLSDLVETFFKAVTSGQDYDRVSPLVEELSGVIDIKEDVRESYAKHLADKYK